MQGKTHVDIDRSTGREFLEAVSAELRRAERYRTFVSFVVIDLAQIAARYGYDYRALLNNLISVAQRAVREVDNVAALDDSKLGFLFPETTRQGAEIAVSRLNDVIRGRLSEMIARAVEDTIPAEMASFPDSSGARTIPMILTELSDQAENQN